MDWHQARWSALGAWSRRDSSDACAHTATTCADGRVTVQTDSGQIRTGRDIAMACMLGAEEWGFAVLRTDREVTLSSKDFWKNWNLSLVSGTNANLS